MRGRGWRTVAVAVALSLVAAACGGSDDTTAEGAEDPVVEDAGSTTDDTLDEDDASDAAAGGVVIGALGGSVQSADGAVTLDIPAGALSDDVAISIEPAPAGAVPDLGDATVLGQAYDFSPDGLVFDAPASVTIAVSAADGVPVGFLMSQTSSGDVEALSGTTIVASGGDTAITADIEHFSLVWATALGAIVVMDSATNAERVGDTFFNDVVIFLEGPADVEFGTFDLVTADPAVLSNPIGSGTQDVGLIESEWRCVSVGSSDFSVIVDLELTNAIVVFLAALLPGVGASVTMQFDGTADCSAAASPAPAPVDCPAATFGDPDSSNVVAVTIDNDCLEPLFFTFNSPNAGDPFWHLHTTQDDIFLSAELYTVYGESWTGQTGTFPLSCDQPYGLCVIFDPDGVGPLPVAQWASGEIVISALADGTYDITFAGTFPAATDGTVYDLQPVTWSN